MLFQPTNVFPSLSGGLGNGVIDADNDLTISWQVNGNTPLTAFQIVIYKNDATSTQVYDTEKLTDGCPFHGISYTGEIQFFSYTITATALALAGITNGNEYKLVITQYSGTAFVTQSAASAFVARATPKISFVVFPTELPYSKYTFELDYPDDADPLNWARWRIAEWDIDASEPEAIIYDTGDMFSASDLRCAYDGFLSGKHYAIKCDVETTYGVEVTTGWTTFTATYDLRDYTGILEAKKICGSTGILVNWDGFIYIPGTPTSTAEYDVTDGNLNLDSGIITWDTVNSEDMYFEPNWSFFFRGKIAVSESTRNAIRLLTDGATHAVSLISQNGNANYAGVTPGSIVHQVAITPKFVAVEMWYPGEALYPATNLYPSTDLYPSAISGYTSVITFKNVDYSQQALEQIRLTGPLSADYVWITQQNASEDFVREIFADDDFSPDFSLEKTLFAATFDEDLNAGNVHGLTSQLDAVSIYRQTNGSATTEHIADIPMAQTQFADYSVASQSSYKYYLYPVGTERMELAPITSDEISICFWNWTILECELDDNGYYRVQAEYLFGKNLTSGTISNNNTPNTLTNFTQYPLVQLSSANYKSGTLSSLIGVIDSSGEYSDTLTLRDAIYSLSTTQNALFLKSRKGDVMHIALSGAISMETMDNTKEQAQTVSLSWVEIGSTEGKNVVSFAGDDFFKSKAGD